MQLGVIPLHQSAALDLHRIGKMLLIFNYAEGRRLSYPGKLACNVSLSAESIKSEFSNLQLTPSDQWFTTIKITRSSAIAERPRDASCH